jgi:hypothetical protein
MYFTPRKGFEYTNFVEFAGSNSKNKDMVAFPTLLSDPIEALSPDE